MTSNISKLFQIAVSTLAIVPLILTFNLSPARAQSTPNAIDDITNLTTKIARNPLQPAPTEESDDENPEDETSTAREKSMEYVKSGYESEEAGNKELALANYLTAAKVDRSNGYAFLLAGRLTDDNELIEMAAQLFKAQRDREGYKLARQLLQAAN